MVIIPAFKVVFKCGNCGHVWSQEFEKGDRVVERLDGVWIHSHKCTHSVSCPYCGKIKCPVCDSKEDIVVIKRRPLIKVSNE